MPLLACVPSKALLRSGHALRAVQHVKGASEAVTKGIAANKVLEYRNKVVDNWVDDGESAGLEGLGVHILRGCAEITGVKSLKIISSDGSFHNVTSKFAVVVATGSSASIPDIKGIQDV